MNGRIEERKYIGESEEMVVKEGEMKIRMNVRGEENIKYGMEDV